MSDGITRWFASAILLVALFSGTARAEGWAVHEWGTFTVLQDELGRELTGVNIDDEPVPRFVHNLSRFLLNPAFLSNKHWRYRQKGAPSTHPLVTMRLETPVIYFHPPRDAKLPASIDVSVQFNGGWLTEFYPFAEVDAPGLQSGRFEFGELKPSTKSTLTWSGLKVGTERDGPQTDWSVWLTPRQVKCAWVTNRANESERYLFYRGVANLRAPLRVTTDRDEQLLRVYGNFSHWLSKDAQVLVPDAWLVHVQEDGRTAYRRLGALRATTNDDALLAATPSVFQARDYASDNLAKLKAMMHEALIAEGLHADEATAMLNTWQRAYFTSPGLRVFYVVPDAWTDAVLPLKVSIDADVQRAMIGRIELITPEHREHLRKIAEGPKPDPRWVDRIPRGPNADKFFAGRADFGDLGVEIPADYQHYLALGRFRNALVVAAEREQKKPTSLTAFIDAYGLHPYRWPSKKNEGDGSRAQAK